MPLHAEYSFLTQGTFTQTFALVKQMKTGAALICAEPGASRRSTFPGKVPKRAFRGLMSLKLLEW
jgi:hypothetical protein